MKFGTGINRSTLRCAKQFHKKLYRYGTWEGTRTLTLSLTPDFESGASTNSATQANFFGKHLI